MKGAIAPFLLRKYYVVYYSKKLKRFKIVQFISLVWMWWRIRGWISKCRDPLKTEMLMFMQDATHIGLRGVGWWIPRHTPYGLKPDLKMIERESFLEQYKHNTDNRS